MPQLNPSPEIRKVKNIIICCDGTGNKFIDWANPKGSNSNVVKFYTTLRIDENQVAYYHPGVGTAGDPAAKRWIAKKWSVLKGLAFAWGFRDTVFDAYRYLMDIYQDGDRVYLIGFSRGSYAVRALGGLLDGYGLLHKGNEGHLPYAWNEYVKQHSDRGQHRVEPNKSFKETFSQNNFSIHFMGIWDTVSSVGWIRTPLRLFSVAHNPIIRTGRHAISIDERRCFYRDNLWTHADSSTLTRKATTKPTDPPQDLLQIWFAGVHSDIGGSYPQKQSTLSNIALNWLLTEATNAGAVTIPQLHALVMGEPVPPSDDPIVICKIAELEKLYKRPTESIVHKSLRRSWWLLELLPHRYYDKDDTKESLRTPLGMRRRIPPGAYIHHSAIDRMEAKGSDYKPKNLKGTLSPIEIPGQPAASVYLFEPPPNSKPVLNMLGMRWLVILLVTAFDLVLAALVLAIVVAIGCWLWTHPILWIWNHWILSACHYLHQWIAAICAAFESHPHAD